MRYIFLKFPYQETWQHFLEILPIFWSLRQSLILSYLISSHLMPSTLKFDDCLIRCTIFCYMAFASLSEILTKHLELHLTVQVVDVESLLSLDGMDLKYDMKYTESCRISII
jgi:hypothetical protein